MQISEMFFTPMERKTVKISELEPGQKATLNSGKDFLVLSNDGTEVKGVPLGSPTSFYKSQDTCEVGERLNICI